MIDGGPPVSSTPIPPDLKRVAIEFNRGFGSVVAWQFLAKHGVAPEQIFALLRDAEGPERGIPLMQSRRRLFLVKP
jgi:hypothetical protein